MTLRDAQEIARTHYGYSLRKVDGEYQAKPKNLTWDDLDGVVIYDTDLDSIMGTIAADSARYVQFLQGKV
jgi:hypothetical protein